MSGFAPRAPRSRTRYLGSVSLVAVVVATTYPASANPIDPVVSAGDAQITAPDPSTVRVDQHTDKVIIDWRSFDIDPDEATVFVQPDKGSVALNRVTSNDPSEILGSLTANGRIFLVNRNGILFGANAKVDVGGLVASTHDITNENFLAGNYRFDVPGEPGARIVNLGEITVADQGLASLVAPSVRNDGVIVAKLGNVALGAANGFTLDLHGDELIALFVEDPVTQEIYDTEGNRVESLIESHGRIEADGGHVLLTAAGARNAVDSVINHDGVIQANTVAERDGKIVLSGGDSGVVKVSGKVDAVGDDPGESGGHIQVTGQDLALLEGGSLDASGHAGGGTVLFGGDYMGGNGDPATIEEHNIVLEESPIPTARSAYLEPGASISADAVTEGDGGKVIVWSDGPTVTGAEISARGGALAGDGGFIETSGAFLDVRAPADASAPNGTGGTWLLDPEDIAIDDTGNSLHDTFPFSYTTTGGNLISGIGFSPTDEGSVLDVDLIEFVLNSGVSVNVTTLGTHGSDDGDIRLRTDVTKTSGGDARFAMNAAGDIDISSGVDVRSFSGALDFEVNAKFGTIDADNIGRMDLNGGRMLLVARDGIDVSSNYDMPRLLVDVNRFGPSPLSDVGVDIDFDDDQVKFFYDDDVVRIPADGIQLVDSTASGDIRLEFYGGLHVALSDRAILGRPDRSWRLVQDHIGALDSDALNDIPEVINYPDASFFVRGFEPDRRITPVIEISHDEGLSVERLAPTSPNGERLINALSAPAEPEQVVSYVESFDPAKSSTGQAGLEEPSLAHITPMAADSPTTSLLNYYSQYWAIGGDEIAADIVTESHWARSPRQLGYITDLGRRVLDNQDNISDTEKLSILLAILDDIASSAGYSGEVFETLNYARNVNQPGQISRDDVIASGSGWDGPVPDGKKEFHVIGIQNPNDVEKYVHPDGREAVFIKDPSLGWIELKDGTNDATYNYVPDSEGMTSKYLHLVMDIIPWLVYGASPEDQTTISDRLAAFEESDMATSVRTFLNPIDSIFSSIE